jgi:large subunit ribosomal protein L10
MGEPRSEKVAVVEAVTAQFEAADAVLVTEYRGLKVSELAALRAAMREGGGEYRIYKNTLVRRAADSLNLDLGEHLTGPTAIAFVKTKADGSPGDIATVAKALKDFAKGNPLLVIKGGVLGESILDANAAIALASLPTGPEIYSRLAGALNSGARGMASVIAGVHRSLAYVLQAAIDAGAFAGDAPASEVTAAEADAPAADAEGSAEATADAPEAEASAGDAGESTDSAAETAADNDAASVTETDTNDSETSESDTNESETNEEN